MRTLQEIKDKVDELLIFEKPKKYYTQIDLNRLLVYDAKFDGLDLSLKKTKYCILYYDSSKKSYTFAKFRAYKPFFNKIRELLNV